MMDQVKWRYLMAAARMQARLFRQRARVVAVEVPPAAARRRGTRWAYVIDCPSTCTCRKS